MPSQNAGFIHSSARPSSPSRHPSSRRRGSNDHFDALKESTLDDPPPERQVSEDDFAPTAPGGQALIGERPVEAQPEEAFTVVPRDPQARQQAEGAEPGQVQAGEAPGGAAVSADSLALYNQDGKLSHWREGMVRVLGF